MIVVLPFHAGEVERLKLLLDWIGQLDGGCHDFDCLLVADAGVDWGHAIDCVDLARKHFRAASIISNPESATGWIAGANSLFFTAAKEIDKRKMGAWLWLETDAIPVKPDWLTQVARAYSMARKPFMGAIYRKSLHDDPGLPTYNLSGIAVYPEDAWTLLQGFEHVDKPFDISCNEATLPNASDRGLIQHFWGNKDLAPTFAGSKGPASPLNTFTLADIQPAAAIFHRCKDGTLIQVLRDKFFPDSDRFITVLPFCVKDGDLMVRQIQWMCELGGCLRDDALIAFDFSTPRLLVNEVHNAARACFRTVWTFGYPAPKSTSHPYAANWAFKHVARFIQESVARPWLWYEADTTVLQSGWIDALQILYARHGMPFFGPQVEGRDHMNGVSIYPWDTFTVCPSIRIVEDGQAFDTRMSPEQQRLGRFDASHYIQQCWCMDNGQVKQDGAGELPHFISVAHVRNNILPSALLFHRIKDASLIEHLRAMKQL